MSFFGCRQQEVIRVPDSTARQGQQTLPPKWIVNILTEGLFLWCVLSVTVDPLFFYVPVINEERKCVALDRRLYIGSTCLRTVLDSILLVDIILQYLRHFANARLRGQESQDGRPESGQNESELAEMTGTENTPKLLTLLLSLCRLLFRYLKFRSELWSLAIDVLAILPIPQVLLPIIFSKLRGSESLNKRKVLTAVVLFQYLPRATRIYLLSVSWRKALTGVTLSKSVIAVKAGFNLFMFIVASHILGAFWYFLSVEREIACWHLACENHIECDRSSFDCNHGSFVNYTFLNDYCPIQTPNTTVFDFGIFQGALQSGTVASMDFPRKILYCFWWGLRNLSSFGSNLQTSPHFWENCFSVLTSISGLLLFLYFLGRLQTYMQLETSKQLETYMDKEDLAKMSGKKSSIQLWMTQNKLPENQRKVLMSDMQAKLRKKEDIDTENLFPHLPISHKMEIKRHLCLPILKKVPMLHRDDKALLERICMYLKPVYYNEHSYIFREGEPIDVMLFITQGIVLKFPTSKSGETICIECIEQGNFYGVQLLQWGLDASTSLLSLSKLPISTETLKTHTKVEAFGLMANDLKTLLSKRASTIQAAWGAFVKKRKEKK